MRTVRWIRERGFTYRWHLRNFGVITVDLHSVICDYTYFLTISVYTSNSQQQTRGCFSSFLSNLRKDTRLIPKPCISVRDRNPNKFVTVALFQLAAATFRVQNPSSQSIPPPHTHTHTHTHTRLKYHVLLEHQSVVCWSRGLQQRRENFSEGRIPSYSSKIVFPWTQRCGQTPEWLNRPGAQVSAPFYLFGLRLVLAWRNKFTPLQPSYEVSLLLFRIKSRTWVTYVLSGVTMRAALQSFSADVLLHLKRRNY